MPRSTKTGIRGYYVDADGRRRIDLRYVDAKGRTQRHKEIFPPGTPARAAERRAKEVLAAAIEGTLARAGEAGAPKNLGSAFEEYLSWAETNGSARAAEDKKRHLAHWTETLGKGFLLGDLSELAVERHKKARREAGCAPATINRELSTLKHFCGRAVDWDWIEKRPKIAMLKEPPGRVRWLSDRERAALAKALGKPGRECFRRLVSGALLSGQRLGNLVALRRGDVDFKHKTMTFPVTKSGKAHHVPISPELGAVLHEALKGKDNDAQAPVFLTRRGTPYTSNGVSRYFKKLSTEAGIEDFKFHDLRHDFATQVRRAGHGLDIVQALLGHASPVMTQRYAHLGRDELLAAMGAQSALKTPLVASVAPALPPNRKKKRKRPIKTAAR